MLKLTLKLKLRMLLMLMLTSAFYLDDFAIFPIDLKARRQLIY